MREGVSVKRSVQFWRIVGAEGEELPGPFPGANLVTALADAESQALDRHLVCRNGMTILAHACGSTPTPTVLLDKVRKENFPSVGNPQGRRARIPLGPDEGLLEPTYISFLRNNVIAVLGGGHGPHIQRFAEYVQTKFDTPITLVPVLRKDLDVVIDEMRMTQIELAIPAENIDRNLIGGDWVEALDGASQLSQDGIIRLGISVGRKGDAAYKASFSEKLKSLARNIRQAAGIGSVETARVQGIHKGHSQTIDLIEDRFVENIQVDPDLLNDPDHSAEYAKRLLREAAEESSAYLKRVVPPVGSNTVDLRPFNGAASKVLDGVG